MKNLEPVLALRIARVVRQKVADAAAFVRVQSPYVRVMALGDQLRISLRNSAKARALVLRALQRHSKP